jgi:hypothetical protein
MQPRLPDAELWTLDNYLNPTNGMFMDGAGTLGITVCTLRLYGVQTVMILWRQVDGTSDCFTSRGRCIMLYRKVPPLPVCETAVWLSILHPLVILPATATNFRFRFLSQILHRWSLTLVAL